MAAHPPGPTRFALGWSEVADALWLAAVAKVPVHPGGTRVPPAGTPASVAPAQSPQETAEPLTPAHPPAGTAAAMAPRHRTPDPGVSIVDAVIEAVVPALPGSRAIARELRPFKRRVPSTTETEPDEEATAERAAEEGLWLPQSRPAPARWLALALIVDDGPSMAVWRPTIAALRLLLERHGAFRYVRTFLLHPGDDRARITSSGGGPRDPAELIDPSGRQVFLVFTDGLGRHWADGRAGRLLHLWGSSAPVAIVNPYPQGHWYRSSLAYRRVRIRAVRPLVPNDRLQLACPARLRNPFAGPVAEHSVPVPLMELAPRWIRWWARLVTEPEGWVDAAVHDTAVAGPPHGADAEPDPPDSAQELVLRFRSTASPTAFRLATLVAAAPLELPLLRKVQRAMLPGSAPFHLAEVVTSDLVRPVPGAPALEFAHGVREVLLACATRDDSARVVRTIAAHYRRRGLTVPLSTDAIEAPDRAPYPEITLDTLPAARIELAVLTALSGPYARRAYRLRRSIAAMERAFAASAPPEPDDHRSTAGHVAAAVRGAGADESGEPMSSPTDPHEETRDAGPAGETFPANVSGPPDPAGHAPSGTADHGVVPAIGLPDPDAPQSVETLLEGQETGQGPRVWGEVPPRNPVFTGRHELLAQLERRLRTESLAAVLPHALHGMGGVGKSQIAIEYVYRHRLDYEVVWWVPSEQPAQILASLIELGKALGLDVGAEANTAVPRVRAALRAGTPYANWLLVFDNAERLDAVRDYFPESGTGKVLVTSRNPDWSQVAETLEVDVFTREESIRLLQRRNPRMSDVDANRLAEAMGDLPLAVEHAAAWEAATGMPPGEYLGLLAEKRAELEPLMAVPDQEIPDPSGADAAVAIAATVALDRLAVENPAALQLLQVCSFFAPEPLSRDLFISPRLTPISPELDSALQDPHRLDQALRDLQRYVLARIDHRTNSIQLHRLVKAVVRGRLRPEQRAGIEHGAHVLLAGVNPGPPAIAENWPRYRTLAPHVTASNAIECGDGWARELVLNLIEFYWLWGDHQSCHDLAERVVERWRRTPGADHRQTLRATKWLAFVLRMLGQFHRAATLSTDSLERCRRVFGADDVATIDAMSLVAADHRVAGRFAQAWELDRDTLDRARAVLGENDPETLRAAHSLGVSLRLTGHFDEARKLDRDTYSRRVVILGPDHLDTLNILNGMTLDERECGEYLKAHRHAEFLYRRHLDLFGPRHPRSVMVARNLAVARRRAGDHDGARKLAEETMHRLRDQFGPAHPDAIAATLGFAVDVREADDLDRAQMLSAQTAQQYEATLGADHPYSLYARTNLGIVLRLLGRLTEAYAHNHAAWLTLTSLLGPTHTLTLTCAVNLASDQAELGDHESAHRLDAETLRVSLEVLGEEHPSTLACALNLAFDLTALGRGAEGDDLFDRTLAAYARVLGRDHPALTAARARVRANCDVDPMPF